jgi:uncharacterized protein (TIGR03435 family)
MAYSAFAGERPNARLLAVVGGPHWIDMEHYDISAKAEGGSSGPRMMGPMLRTLLEDRFQVKVHTGSQKGSVYALTVLKSNPKLQPSKEGSCIPDDLTIMPRPAVKPGEARPRYCGGGRGHPSGRGTGLWEFYGVTMAEFGGRLLAGFVDRPIIDKTGLAGQFDIHLEFVPHPPMAGPGYLNGEPVPETPAPPDESAGPSIFTALETQLGLKLTPAKATLDLIVVDQAERPSAN